MNTQASIKTVCDEAVARLLRQHDYRIKEKASIGVHPAIPEKRTSSCLTGIMFQFGTQTTDDDESVFSMMTAVPDWVTRNIVLKDE